MRIIIAMFLTFFMTSCSSKSSELEARFDIRVSSENRSMLVETMKKFGQNQGFEVFTTDNLPKEGRLVSQVLLKRADGVLIVTSNFRNADIFETTFHTEKPNADWRSVKEAWLKAVTEALNGRGEIIERSVDTEPNATEEERKKRGDE